MAERITSRANPLLVHIRKLASSRAHRYDTGEYLGDGVKLLEEAARWDAGYCPAGSAGDSSGGGGACGRYALHQSHGGPAGGTVPGPNPPAGPAQGAYWQPLPGSGGGAGPWKRGDHPPRCRRFQGGRFDFAAGLRGSV